jgi:cell division protein FtsZ
MAAPRKAKGLLAKVTGAARAFHEATQSNGQPEPAQGAPRSEAAGPAGVRKTAAPRQATAARPPAGEARVEQAAAPAPSAATQKPAAAKTDPALNQPRLTGLDPAERVGVSQSEEDLLDIPAFLRRQAN